MFDQHKYDRDRAQNLDIVDPPMRPRAIRKRGVGLRGVAFSGDGCRGAHAVRALSRAAIRAPRRRSGVSTSRKFKSASTNRMITAVTAKRKV